MLAASAPPTVNQYGSLRATRLNVKENGEHIYAAKYSEDGKLFAATYGSGVCRVFDAETFQPLQRMKPLPQHDDVPSTSVKWRKMTEEGVYDFASCSSGGGVYGWHWDRSEDPSGGYVERAWKGIEDNNETASIDYCPDGSTLVSVGSDRKVRVYDVETRKLIDTMERGHDESGHTRPAHTNRIFSAKFATATTLLTGGWANPIQIWDMRTRRSERQLGGPAIGSDSIEPIEGTNRVIISSTRKENQLQVFDFISGTEVIAESEKYSKGIGNQQLYGVRYLKATDSLFCIACKPDSIIHMDAKTGEVREVIDDLGVPIHSADVIPNRPTSVLFSGAKETLVVVDVA